MPSGIIVIDKSAGWTSMDVCAKLRGILGERRIGHGGTLDPMATGVLPVFVGRATRAVEYAMDTQKEYIAGLELGVVTNTQDTTGQVLETHPVQVSREALLEVLARFTGEILQVPPMYAAIKIGGQKLYQLARKGKEVERPARPVTIYELALLDQTPPEGTGFLLRVLCSKGTYVRTLCHDIGQALGCGGAMSSLRRTRTAGFTQAEAVPLEVVQAAADRGESLLLPVDEFFTRNGWAEKTVVSPAAERVLRNGGTAICPGGTAACRVYSQDGTFLGLGDNDGGRLRLAKSFYEVP